jgi:SSS family solute:Na+ symporter
MTQILVFLALTSFVALATWHQCRSMERSSDDVGEFFLAGRSLDWRFVAGSILLTNISAEQLVGMNGAQSLLVAWWEIAAAAGLLILAHWLLPVYFELECTTTTELLERRLGDPKLRALVSGLFLIGYAFILLPAVLYTGALFLVSTFGVDLPIPAVATLLAIVGTLYAVVGGLRAVAVSDTLNSLGLLALGGLVTYLGLARVGFTLDLLPPERLTLIGGAESAIPWTTLLTGMLFIQVFYWGTNMVIVQRALAARSLAEAQRGVHVAVLFKLAMPLLVVVPGLVSYQLFGPVGDAAYGMLVREVLPPSLAGAFAAVLAGAVLSTFNSCLNSAAALYTCDLHVAFVDPEADVVRLGRRVSLLLAGVALLLVPAFQRADSVLALLQQLNGLYSMPVLAAFLVALLAPDSCPRRVRSGVLFGAALYAFFTFAWTPLHYIHLMAITLLATIAWMVAAPGESWSGPGTDFGTPPVALGGGL